MNNPTKTVSIEVNDEICTLSHKVTREHYPSKQKHTILYVRSPFNPEDFGLGSEPEYSRKGDNPELDKAWRKYNKAELGIQKELIMHAVSHGMIEESLAKELKWSRKAGCSCGCSPGWKSRDYRRQSMWLELISPSKEQERKERYRDITAEQEAKTLSSMVI